MWPLPFGISECILINQLSDNFNIKLKSTRGKSTKQITSPPPPSRKRLQNLIQINHPMIKCVHIYEDLELAIGHPKVLGFFQFKQNVFGA